MNVFRVSRWCLVAAVAVCGASFNSDRSIAAEPAEEGIEVLTRGPVHEAFAETVTFDPEPGIVVPKAPPAGIEELPPDQKPEGANVAWIPGYWAWDDERTDFLWVSGIWRALPPGRQWVSGYWGASGEGAQWTSGYWADAKASEVEYLPEPPQSVEVGPNIAAPSAEQSWVPGCWTWHQNRYAWRPGYWAAAQKDWVWVPDHYVAAPRGYVHVDGYWDYSVGRRGLLFAPVYFNPSVYSRRGFSYSPVTVIDTAVFASQLFLRPRYQHYYFGDYYAASYASAGFHPWFSYQSSRYGYDPIFVHQRWQHRQNAGWERNLQADFRNRRDNQGARPPRTLAAQQALLASGAADAQKNVVLATSLDQLAKSKDSPLRLQSLDKQERQKLSQRAQEFRSFREQRNKLEAASANVSAEAPAKGSQPVRVKLPTSPVVASGEVGADQAPPKRHEVLKPVLDVEPKPRANRGNPGVPKVQPDATTAQPKAERPKVEPKPERPTAAPRPERPKAETKPERPSAAPRPEQPKAEPRPDRPKAEPRPERPKAEPRPERPKAEPRPERPRAEPKPAPKRESPNGGQGASNDKPRNERNEKSKK